MVTILTLIAIASLTCYSLNIYSSVNALQAAMLLFGMAVIAVLMMVLNITVCKDRNKRVIVSLTSIAAAMTLSNAFERLILSSGSTWYPILTDGLLLMGTFVLGLLISGSRLLEMHGISWLMIFVTLALPLTARLYGPINGAYIALPGGVLLAPCVLFSYVTNSAYFLTVDFNNETLGGLPKTYVGWYLLTIILTIELIVCKELSSVLAVLLIFVSLVLIDPRHTLRDLFDSGSISKMKKIIVGHKKAVFISVLMIFALIAVLMVLFIGSTSEKIMRVKAFLTWKDNINNEVYAQETLKSFRVLLLNIKRSGLYGLGADFSYLHDVVPTIYNDHLLIKYLLENGIIFTLAFLALTFTLTFALFYAASKSCTLPLRMLNSGIATMFLVVLLMHCSSNLCSAPVLGITTVTGDGSSFTAVFGFCFGFSCNSIGLRPPKHKIPKLLIWLEKKAKVS